MNDRDFPELRTTGAPAGANTVAERGTIALAVLALAGGMLIALGNLLGDGGPGEATPSPVARATPRPAGTPRPTPLPLEVAVTPGDPPEAPVGPEPYYFNGWIRILVDQPILTSTGSQSAATGEIAHAGDLLFAYRDQEGWFQIDGAVSGFLREADGATLLVEALAPDPYLASGDIWSLTAGANGFVALGYPTYSSDAYGGSFAVFSPDGETWRMTDLPWFINAVAWGPAGWIGAGRSDGPTDSSFWVYHSDDGLRWVPLGEAAGIDYAIQLVGSDLGYLLEIDSGGRSGPSPTLLFSVDGLTWTESERPDIPTYEYGGPMIAGLDAGFHAWRNDLSGTQSRPAFSANGRTWSSGGGDEGPRGANLRFTVLAGRVLAMGTSTSDGAIQIWTGTPFGNDLIWSSGGPAAGLPTDVALAGLASDGQHAVALVWQRSTDEPSAWTSTDGTSWTRARLAAGGFGGIPRLLAAGPAGVVAVGSRATLRGANPIFWREVGGRWLPEPDPLFDVVPDPPTDACGPPIRDVLDFVIRDRDLAVACHGDAPFTFRAYSVRCPECMGGPQAGMTPQWLASPSNNVIFLSPTASGQGWNGDTAVLHPSLQPNLAWLNAWVELTGHFDDAEAASCHWSYSVSDEVYYSGQRWVVDECRRRFVVTSVTVVDGP